MTRGYVAIIKGKKVISVAYLNSDAYLSYYGYQILEAIKLNKIEEWVTNQRKDNIAAYGKKDDPCDGFALNWIMPDKESRVYGKEWNYEEYGYVYNIGKTLKVYHYGELLFTIDLDQENIERYLYVFKYETELYNTVAYDPDKMDNVLTFNQVIKKIQKYDLARLKKMVSTSASEKIYLSDDHCIAPGHDPNGGETYAKTLCVSDWSKGKLEFIVQHYGKIGEYGWDVYLQTPFLRVRAISGPYKYGAFRSEKTAVQAIREKVKQIGIEKMLRTAKIFKMYEEAKDNVKMYEEAKDNEKFIQNFCATLDYEWEKSPWWVPDQFVSVDGLKKEIQRF